MFNILLIIVGILLINPLASFASDNMHFSEYDFSVNGFKASFPSKPVIQKTDFKDGGYSTGYKSIIADPPSQYSIFVSHLNKKLFDDAAIKKYLEGFVVGMSKNMNNAKIVKSTHTKYMNYPALDYAVSYIDEGNELVIRGIMLIVDGDYYILSLLHLKEDNKSKVNFEKFKKAFKLVANKYQPAPNIYSNREHKISVNTPSEWDIEKGKYPQIAAVISNPAGHSITLMSSNVSGYNCKSYQQEIMKSLGKLKTEATTISGKSALTMKGSAYNPSAKIEMTSVHYCVDLPNKIIILIGAAPKDTFFRSSDIFANVASSLKWQ